VILFQHEDGPVAIGDKRRRTKRTNKQTNLFIRFYINISVRFTVVKPIILLLMQVVWVMKWNRKPRFSELNNALQIVLLLK
jgi:hypothetical protein